ncbi:MAG: hypothetical protein IEMM0008_0168 [bacterium]|nr:MAG: hypothetical protein IEMM0008_0168 [bacterium]
MKKILLLLLLGLMTFVLSYCEIGVQPRGARRARYKKQPVIKEHPGRGRYKRRHEKERFKKRKKRRYRRYRRHGDDD